MIAPTRARPKGSQLELVPPLLLITLTAKEAFLLHTWGCRKHLSQWEINTGVLSLCKAGAIKWPNCRSSHAMGTRYRCAIVVQGIDTLVMPLHFASCIHAQSHTLLLRVDDDKCNTGVPPCGTILLLHWTTAPTTSLPPTLSASPSSPASRNISTSGDHALQIQLKVAKLPLPNNAPLGPVDPRGCDGIPHLALCVDGAP